MSTRLSPRVTKYSPILDVTRRYLTDSLTPAALAGYLKDADDGDVAAMIELDEEMQAKDWQLADVVSMRRESITAIDWEIVPDTKAEDKQAAEHAANYCQRQLDKLTNWDDALTHWQTAVGPGVAAVELVWHKGELVDTIDVPGHRLTSDPWGDPDISIATEQNQIDGAPIYSPGYAMYTPHARAGFPLKVTITRAQAWLYLIKHHIVSMWTEFAEVFGHPWRIATFKRDSDPTEQAQVEAMLRDMGRDTYGMFTDAVDVKFLEAARANQPFEGIVDWLERKQAILWLGQTLTTEQQSVGSLALGRVHENVKASILLGDLKKEARMIRQQVLTWMVRFKFPNSAMPVPVFKRRVVEQKNLDEQRLALDKLRYMDERQLPVDTDVVYDMLDIPLPKEGVTPHGTTQDNASSSEHRDDPPAGGAPSGADGARPFL